MTPDSRRLRVDAILEEVLDCAPEERPTFLEGACAGDPGLRREVEELLDLVDEPSPALDPEAIARGPLLQDLSRDLEAGGGPGPGDRIGQWRLVRELGRGGMGVVYLVERAEGSFRQVAALKLIYRDADSE